MRMKPLKGHTSHKNVTKTGALGQISHGMGQVLQNKQPMLYPPYSSHVYRLEYSQTQWRDTALQHRPKQAEERNRSCEARFLVLKTQFRDTAPSPETTRENTQSGCGPPAPRSGALFLAQQICFWFALVISVAAANFILLH